MIEELQRTVITLSRENKELNERNDQLRRQLVDIGAKVRSSFHRFGNRVIIIFFSQNWILISYCSVFAENSTPTWFLCKLLWDRLRKQPWEQLPKRTPPVPALPTLFLRTAARSRRKMPKRRTDKGLAVARKLVIFFNGGHELSVGTDAACLEIEEHIHKKNPNNQSINNSLPPCTIIICEQGNLRSTTYIVLSKSSFIN